MTPDDARKALEKYGIEFSDSSFFKYIKAGDREIVELFLDSGLPPDVRDSDGNAAVVVAIKAEQKDLARVLLARGASPEPLLNAPTSKKDAWDRLTASSAVLSIISSLLIAAVGGYLTYTINKRQLDFSRAQASQEGLARQQEDLARQQANKILELDTVQKMIPTLTSSDEAKRATALTVIQHFGNPTLAINLAIILRGKGSNLYLQKAASGPDSAVSQLAARALSDIAASSQGINSALAKSSPSGLKAAISAIFYVRDRTNWIGEFRRSGKVWKESFEDLIVPREWKEVQGGPNEILLTSFGAKIRIDLQHKWIYYSDPGTDLRLLDTITNIE